MTMARFDKREAVDRARTALHEIMQIQAIYHSPDRSTTVSCRVRLHENQQTFGDMTGFDFDPAERVMSVPKVIAFAAEITPSRGGVFSLGPTEQYQVETVLPRDGLTITSQVSRRSQTKVAAEPLAYPGQV